MMGSGRGGDDGCDGDGDGDGVVLCDGVVRQWCGAAVVWCGGGESNRRCMYRNGEKLIEQHGQYVQVAVVCLHRVRRVDRRAGPLGGGGHGGVHHPRSPRWNTKKAVEARTRRLVQ